MQTALKILIIEDDESIGGYLKAVIPLAGRDANNVDVCVAWETRGDTGLEEAMTTQPDLVFLDIRLPGLDGLTVLKRLRACTETEKLPVVTMTAFDYDPWKLLGAGATAHIEKSSCEFVEPAKLWRLVQRIVGVQPCRC